MIDRNAAAAAAGGGHVQEEEPGAGMERSEKGRGSDMGANPASSLRHRITSSASATVPASSVTPTSSALQPAGAAGEDLSAAPHAVSKSSQIVEKERAALADAISTGDMETALAVAISTGDMENVKTVLSAGALDTNPPASDLLDKVSERSQTSTATNDTYNTLS